MRKNRSDFSFHISDGVVAIIDHDNGGMSVTNDIENVVEYICLYSGIRADEYKWIYRDSEEIWDGWDPVKNTFVHLQMHSESEAREQILRQ